MKKNPNLPKLIVSIAVTAAVLVAIISYSIAWFSARNTTVIAKSATFAAEGISSLLIETQADESYGRYMGQTGIVYDGLDSPYYLTYTPFTIDTDVLEEDNIGPYFTYKLTELSKIKYVISGSTPYELTEEECWDNFSMELRHAEYNEETETYEETGDLYRSENGFFRNVDDGTLLSFAEDPNQTFILYIYFQGDVAMKLLAETQDDIDSDYTFDFCDETYMFANFTLSALFDLENMHTITFISDGYEANDSHTPIGRSSSLAYRFPTTGFDLVDAEGVKATWPIGEIYLENDVDYSYYFMDWAAKEYNEKKLDYDYLIYRETSSISDIYKLSTRPLRDKSVTLYALVGRSPVLTLDLENEQSDVECFMRPTSNYYQKATANYNYTTQTITITNPTIVDGEVQNVVTNTIAAPQKDGFFFVGWSSSETPSYTNGELNDAFHNTGISIDQDTTLYAVYKEKANIDLTIPTTWGNNYARLTNISVTKGGNAITTRNGVASIFAEKNTDAYESLKNYSATATATIGSETRTLTLKGWTYNNGTEWVMLSSTNTFALGTNTTLYAVWNERKTYSITLDIYETLKVTALSLKSSNLYGSITVNNPVSVEYYTIRFNGNLTGTFKDSNQNGISVTNIPEGVTLSNIGISNSSSSVKLEDADSIFIKRNLTFKQWEITDNNTNETSSQHDGTAVSLTTAICDTFLATLNNNTIYAFFKYIT